MHVNHSPKYEEIWVWYISHQFQSILPSSNRMHALFSCISSLFLLPPGNMHTYFIYFFHTLCNLLESVFLCMSHGSLWWTVFTNLQSYCFFLLLARCFRYLTSRIEYKRVIYKGVLSFISLLTYCSFCLYCWLVFWLIQC